MRAVLALVPLLFSARLLVAQPFADAPLPWHVEYLIASARSGFWGVLNSPPIQLEYSATTTVFMSGHRIRFFGVDVWSKVSMDVNGDAVHSTFLPILGGSAAADSVVERLASEIATVIPAGWQLFGSSGDTRQIRWQGCDFGLRRAVELSAHSSGVSLKVYYYRMECHPWDGAGTYPTGPPQG